MQFHFPFERDLSLSTGGSIIGNYIRTIKIKKNSSRISTKQLETKKKKTRKEKKKKRKKKFAWGEIFKSP